MAGEDGTIIETTPQPDTRAQERIRQLSEKVELTAKERDEKSELLQKVSEEKTNLEKERDFYANFSDVVSQNPAAKDHKDEILTKVKSGYSVEDATYAVLGKAGKLGSQATTPDPIQPAGGSASYTPAPGGPKSVNEMSRDEKREALMQIEREGGITLT